MRETFKNKLKALNHHAPDKVDVNDENEFRSLVVWLEDQKIRHYKIEDRGPLREIQSPKWPEAYKNYCKDIESPIQSSSSLENLEWLLCFAVRLEYSDNAQKYSTQTAENVLKSRLSAPTVTSSNPLDNLNFDSEEFKNGVMSLARLLSVTAHPNHLVVLEAITRVLSQQLNKGVDKGKDSQPQVDQNKVVQLLDGDLGFELEDYIFNQAAKILRLLYIHDLRDLQTKINECIVAVQTITANPKTDTKLGKVGY